MANGWKTNRLQSKRSLSVGVVGTHPIQYHAPLWRRLSATPALEVEVLYGSDFSLRGYRDRDFGVNVAWDQPLLEGYSSRFLPGYDRVDFASFRQPSPYPVFQAIMQSSYDALLITAYNSMFCYAALAAAVARGIPVVMRHEASDDASSAIGLKATLRRLLLKAVYSRVTCFGIIGETARLHLQKMGIRKDKMFFSPYCVDTDWIGKQVDFWSPKRVELRTNLGIAPDEFALVFSGKLISKKDPITIIDALSHLSEDLLKKLHILVVGDGPLRATIERSCQTIKFFRSHFLGFLNQNEIGRAYAAGDFLVLGSLPGCGETWGLVVNEAMHFGLPVILSDGVGCHRDLLIEGVTGKLFKAGNALQLSDAVKDLMRESDNNRDQFRRQTLNLINRYSLERAAAGLAEALFAATDRNRATAFGGRSNL